MPIFISSTYGITVLHKTYWCPASSAAYDWLGLLTESLDHIRLMVAPATVQLMLAGLHQTSGCPTLRAAYVG